MIYPITCPRCNGTKKLPGPEDRACFVCKGEGTLQKVPEFVVNKLKEAEAVLKQIREAYHISEPGETLDCYELDAVPGSDDRIEVIADGFGGATLQRIEGDGDNTMTHGSRDFMTEDEACQAADLIDGHRDVMEDILDG